MEKIGRSAEASPARGRYASAGVSTEVKEHTAAFAVALQARGVSLETLVSALKVYQQLPGGSESVEGSRAAPSHVHV